MTALWRFSSRLGLICLVLSLPLPGKPDDPLPFHMNLLPGYHHKRLRGIDSWVGRIWKRGGVRISYDKDMMAPDDRHAQPPEEWRRLCAWRDDAHSHNKPDAGDVLCWIDADADGRHKVLAALFPDATKFYALVKNQRQIDEALKMLLTYDPTPPPK
jgi:hypothetical protein